MKADIVVRPNGKVYRPRKGLRQRGYVVDDFHASWTPFVAVFGTHDIEKATEYARPFMYAGLKPGKPGWLRDTIRDGEPFFDHDPVRGAACVIFEETDDPELYADANETRGGASLKKGTPHA